MIEFQGVTPVFLVGDVGQTVRWYERVLGFAAQTHPEIEPYHWACLRKGDVEIMLQWASDYAKPDLQPLRSGGVWDAYIGLRGLDDLYEEIGVDVVVTRKPCNQPYGRREFEIRDLNGYILVFSEPT